MTFKLSNKCYPNSITRFDKNISCRTLRDTILIMSDSFFLCYILSIIMLDIRSYCLACTYYDVAHFPSSCHALQDIPYSIICTVIINLYDNSPGGIFSQISIMLSFYFMVIFHDL